MTALRTSPTGNFEPVAEAVANEYAHRLARAGSMLQVTVPVRRRLHHQPIFHLLFLTRSPYGLWVFADGLGKARQVWLRALGRLDDDAGEQGVLFSRSENMEWLIDSEKDRAQEIITANLRTLLQTAGVFKLVNQVLRVFGEAYGFATESTVTKAVQDLKSRGELVIHQPASRIRDRVVGRPRN